MSQTQKPLFSKENSFNHLNQITIQKLQNQSNCLRRATSNHQRHKSPARIQHISINAAKNASTSKGNIIRICSRGINVISSRPSSIERKHHLQSQKGKLNTDHNDQYNSQTITSSILNEPLNPYLKLQIQAIVNDISQKCTAQLSHCQSAHNTELQKLGEVIRQNQSIIDSQRIKINELNDKIIKNQKRIQKYYTNQQNINAFKKYHQQCHQYTFGRINDIEKRLALITHNIQKYQQLQNLPFIVESIRQTVAKIITNSYQLRITSHLQAMQQIQQIQSKVTILQKQLQKLLNINLEQTNQLINFEVFKNQIHLFKSIFKCWQQSFTIPQQQINNKQKDLLVQLQSISQQLNNLQNNQNKSKFIQQENQNSKFQYTIDRLQEQKALQQQTHHQQLQKIQKQILQYNNKIKQLEQNLYKMKTQKQKLLAYQKNAFEKIEQLKATIQNLTNEKQQQYAFYESQMLRFIQSQNQFKQQLNLKKQFIDQQKNVLIKNFIEVDTQTYQVNKLAMWSSISLTIKNNNNVNLTQSVENQPKSPKNVIYYSLSNCTQNKIDELIKQNSMLKQQIYQMTRQCKQITQQISHTIIQNNQLKQQNKLLSSKYEENKKYMNHYISAFQQQSQSFQNTIKKLQKEIQQISNSKQILKKQFNQQSRNLQYYREKNYMKNKSDVLNGDKRVELKTATDSFQNAQFSQGKTISSSKYLKKSLNSKIQNSKLQQLKNALQICKFQIPVLCEIDETGYLKNYESGTYIIDQDGNLFCLSESQMQTAILNKIICLP